MHALTRAVLEPGGVLGRVDCQPPLTLRQVRSDDPAVCAICLVGTAAGPLAGDDLTLELVLRDGAAATLQAAGASLAQGRGGAAGAAAGALTTRVRLGRGARLDARPGAVVVGGGSRVDVTVALELEADSEISWRELVILGRAAEASGALTLRWDVTQARRPLLRQFLDLTDPAASAWPGMLGGARVIASALIVSPTLEARTTVVDATAAAVALDPHALLLTVLGSDAASVTARLADLEARVRTAPVTAQ